MQDTIRKNITITKQSVSLPSGTLPVNEGTRSSCGERTKKQCSETSPLLCEDRDEVTGNQYGICALWESEEIYSGIACWKRPSVYWLLPPFFFYAMAVGGVLVPKLNLVLYLLCRNYLMNEFPNDSNLKLPTIFNENSQCQIPEIQAISVEFTLYMTIVTGILSALMSPRLGAWSDRYGRLRTLSIISLGALTADLLIILFAKYPDIFNYRWLLLTSMIDGMCGSFIAGFAITHAYAADCTAPVKRAVAFGYFHASLFMGVAVGPLLAAFLVRHSRSLLSAFYAAVGLHLFFVTLILLIVPESLIKARRQSAPGKDGIEENDQPRTLLPRINISRQNFDFITPMRIFFPADSKESFHRINLIFLLSIDAIVTGINLSAVTIIIYYLGYEYNLNTAEQGIFTSTVNVCRFCALMFIPRLFHKFFSTYCASLRSHSSNYLKERTNRGCNSLDLLMIRSGILFETLGYIGYATARSNSIFVAAGVLGSMGSFASPTLKSALTKHVSPDQVGQLLGSMGFLHSLMRILCPVLLNLIYAVTVGRFPQAVFIVLACCLGTAFLLSLRVRANDHTFDKELVNSYDQHLSRSDLSVDDYLTK